MGWPKGRPKCAIGIDADVGLVGSSSISLEPVSRKLVEYRVTSSLVNPYPTLFHFECHPSPGDNNGDLELGMPGTVHRRRWRYNEPGAEGKTGSCCNHFSCSACEEKFTIQALRAECGLGEGWLCASQHG